MEAFLSVPSVKAINFWGFADKYHTMVLSFPEQKPGLFDVNNSITDSYTSVQNTLLNFFPPGAGDVEGDGKVDLADAVLGLRICVGVNPNTVNIDADIDGNQKIDLKEIIYYP